MERPLTVWAEAEEEVEAVVGEEGEGEEEVLVVVVVVQLLTPADGVVFSQWLHIIPERNALPFKTLVLRICVALMRRRRRMTDYRMGLAFKEWSTMNLLSNC